MRKSKPVIQFFLVFKLTRPFSDALTFGIYKKPHDNKILSSGAVLATIVSGVVEHKLNAKFTRAAKVSFNFLINSLLLKAKAFFHPDTFHHGLCINLLKSLHKNKNVLL
jgi:hypothetical protein